MSSAVEQPRAAAPVVERTRVPGLVSIVVPIHNSMRHLERTLNSIEEARAGGPATELLLVDHSSTDGSTEFIRDRWADRATILRLEGGTISHVRNLGAQHARGEYLSFLDSDTLIPTDYFRAAVEVLRDQGASATGSTVALPDQPHWIEDAWFGLNTRTRDGFTHFMNSANFFVTAEAFDAVGGFDETLRTGEDAEICQRICESGRRIYEAKRVKAIHLGNPGTIASFYRKQVWHGIGQFGTFGLASIDKPVMMTLLHAALTLSWVVAAFAGVFSSEGLLVGLLVSQAAVPVVAVLYRMVANRTRRGALRSVFLYWLYFWARIAAIWYLVRSPRISTPNAASTPAALEAR